MTSGRPTRSAGDQRLRAAFERASQRNRTALLPYLCAGDPDAATSAQLLRMVARLGADVIELGIPYGDPLADGPTIATAAQRALARGMSVDGALRLAAEAIAAGAPPIVVFSYYNPIVQYGLERFAGAIAASGISGAIVPDAPLEELGDLRAAFAPHGLALPLLIAPTTPPERAARLAAESEGFVYVVSRLGVTGVKGEPDIAWLESRLRELRAATNLPLAVGFGVANSGHVRAIGALADGAIVGSALIDAYAGSSGDEAVECVRAAFEGLAEGAERTRS